MAEFDLPSGWLKSKLSAAIQPRGEKALPSEHPNAPFLGMDHIEAQTTRIIGSVPAVTMKSSAARFYAGDVLYGRLRPYLNKVAQPSFGGLASAEFIVFPNTELVFSKFLRLRLNAADFVRFSSHLNEGDRPRVSFEQIGEFEILIPPAAEQHRIVAKIEELFSELDKGVDSLKTAREQLKVYRQALLKHAFEGKLTAQWRAENSDKLETATALQQRIQTERQERRHQQLTDWEAKGKQGSKPKAPKPLPPLSAEELAELPELPAGWVWIRLGNSNVDVSDGPFGSNLKSSDYVENGVRVIRLENIGPLEFVESKKSYVSEAKYELLKNHTVATGDIVFSSFITENIRVALLPSNIEKAINKADCFCIRLHGVTLSNIFTVMFLSTRRVFKQLEDQIHGVGRPRINTTQLKEVVVPVCCPEEQQVLIVEVESKLSEADQLDQTLATALQQSAALRQSILKKAFCGQLVKQDKNDEPASVLLERIRAEKLNGMKPGKLEKSS